MLSVLLVSVALVISQNDYVSVPRAEQLAPQPKTIAITPGKSFFFNIDFEFDSATLDKGYLKNRYSLGRIEHIIDSLGTSGIAKIEVISQSSPEGSSSYNVALADRRSISVSNYLAGLSSSLSGKIKRFQVGESWTQLITCVEQDALLSSASKQRIVSVLSSKSIVDRKNGMQALGSDKAVGDIYEYLLATYYPVIRNTAVYLASKSSESASFSGEQNSSYQSVNVSQPVQKNQKSVVRQPRPVQSQAQTTAPQPFSAEESQSQTQYKPQSQVQSRSHGTISSTYAQPGSLTSLSVSENVSKPVPSITVVSTVRETKTTGTPVVSNAPQVPQVVNNTALVPVAVGSSQALVPVVTQR